LGEFIEVESGKLNNRPQLTAAMRHARVTHATLIVAKLDRLSRNAAFLNELFDATLPIRCVDMPFADRFAIGIMAQVAQWERERISERTRSALAAAKARGAKLGGRRTPQLEVSAVGREQSIVTRRARAAARRCDLLPYVEAARSAGCGSLRSIAVFLNQHQIPTARGGKWHAANVSRLLASL
jgi:DNA invertase Pin-like site-specific DNA recombinase